MFRADSDPRLTLPGYHSIVARCRDDGGRGGVGLFVKDTVKFKIREDLNVFTPHVFESIITEVLHPTEKNTIVGMIYRTKTQPRADVDIFASTLFDIMDIVNSEEKNIVYYWEMSTSTYLNLELMVKQMIMLMAYFHMVTYQLF